MLTKILTVTTLAVALIGCGDDTSSGDDSAGVSLCPENNVSPPLLVGIPDQSSYRGDDLVVNVTANVCDPRYFSFYVNANPLELLTGDPKNLFTDSRFQLSSGPLASQLTITPEPSLTGTMAVVLNLLDQEGRTSSQDFSWRIQENRAPSFLTIPNATTRQGDSFIAYSAALDPEGSDLTYDLSSETTNALSTWAVSDRAYDDFPMIDLSVVFQPDFTGTANLRFKVSDGVNIYGQNFFVMVSPNGAPTMEAIPSQSTVQDTTHTVVISANDPDGDPITYTLTSVPADRVDGRMNGGILLLTPDTTFSGLATLTLKAESYGPLEATRTFDLEVTAKNPPTNSPPTLLAIPAQSTLQNVNKTVSITASDPDGDTITYTVTSVPEGKVTGTVSGSTLTLIPDSTFTGTATVTLRASDATSEVNQRFTLVVAQNQPPSLSPISDQSTGQGVSKTVGITVSDIEDYLSLTYSLTSVPEDKVTGTVSGSTLTLIPVSTFKGTATLTLTVSDGLTDVSQTFKLVVTQDIFDQSPFGTSNFN